MDIDWGRYDAALERNLAELTWALLKRRALLGLHSEDSTHRGPFNFFEIAAHALYNDLLSHAIRVFDRQTEAASFWYVVRCDQASAHAVATALGVDLDQLGDLAGRLKTIRDKTLFHIDKKAVAAPQLVWEAADVKAAALGFALEGAFGVLAALYLKRHGISRAIPDYDGSDAMQIMREYSRAHPETGIVV